MKVMNVGCGSTPIEQQTLLYDGWEEIRVDNYPNPTAGYIAYDNATQANVLY